MPKINAPSVAEHRAQQLQAIMDATFDLLQELGAAPSLAQVAARAGLSRTSIYQYYKSPIELLQAAAREVYPRWISRITAAVQGADSPQQAVLAYAFACVDQVAEGGHAVGTALASITPEDGVDGQAEDMHDAARLPLLTSLEDLGVQDPEAICELVTSVIHAAGQMVNNGVELSLVHRHLEVMLGNIGRSA